MFSFVKSGQPSRRPEDACGPPNFDIHVADSITLVGESLIVNGYAGVFAGEMASKDTAVTFSRPTPGKQNTPRTRSRKKNVRPAHTERSPQ